MHLTRKTGKAGKLLTKELGDKVQLVGDDLFVTNTERLKKWYRQRLRQCHSDQVKSDWFRIRDFRGNQDGSQSRLYGNFLPTVPARRKTPRFADLAVALNTCQIKTGAPSRTERVAKYNQLLRIEEELGNAAVYPGMGAFNVK